VPSLEREVASRPAGGAADPARAGGLRDEVLRAGLDLFAAYGVRFSPPQAAEVATAKYPDLPPVLFLGVCGFGGPTFTGHVVLGASEGVLHRSNNTRSSSDDWMAELANQFLGRIKNGLLRQGIHVHRVPPVVIKGAAVALAHGHGDAPLTLGDGHDRVLIWLDAEPSTDEMPAQPQAEADVLGEGDMVLF
jgi:hypothetical protein